jgi:hypothetical protein
MENATIVPDDDDISIGSAEGKPSVAFIGKHRVWLAADTRCSHCDRALRATDVDANFGDVRLICAACHNDVLVIGSAS